MERANMEGRRRFSPVAVFLILAVPGIGTSGRAAAQLRETVKPIKIVQIYGRDTLDIGEIETYRVRVNVAYEAAYSWKISDGTVLGGNPIVYRFKKPGRYTLVAMAVNPTGKDADTLEVYVRPKAPPPPALASKEESPSAVKKPEKPASTKHAAVDTKTVSTGKSSPEGSGLKGERLPSGHYTWVIATYFRRPPAEALANSYRAVGFRSSVIVDSGGKGSTVFRVTLGQFDSEQKALEAKGEVLSNGIVNPLLHKTGGA